MALPTPVFPIISIWGNDQLSTLGYGSKQVVVDAGGVAQVLNVDNAQTSFVRIVLTGTNRVLNMLNGRPGESVMVQVVQDGTGSRTIATYTDGLWAAGTPPTLTTAANGIDMLRATWDATLAVWFWETVGKAYA